MSRAEAFEVARDSIRTRDAEVTPVTDGHVLLVFWLDIHECDIPGKCSQLCDSSKGDVTTCSCVTGYSLEPNRRSCKAIGKPRKLSFFENSPVYRARVGLPEDDLMKRKATILKRRTNKSGFQIRGAKIGPRLVDPRNTCRLSNSLIILFTKCGHSISSVHQKRLP